MRRFALMLFVAAAVGCGQYESPTIPDSTLPPVQPTTESFTGTVAVSGANTHNFSVVRSNGLLTIVLTQAAPPANVVMGVGVGQPSGTGCLILLSLAAVSGTPVLAQTVNAGSYCVVIGDIGNATAPVNYTITVNHY